MCAIAFFLMTLENKHKIWKETINSKIMLLRVKLRNDNFRIKLQLGYQGEFELLKNVDFSPILISVPCQLPSVIYFIVHRMLLASHCQDKSILLR